MPLLTDEQSIVPRPLASIDGGVTAYGILRHPALRVALSRTNDSAAAGVAHQRAHDRPLLALLRHADGHREFPLIGEDRK